MVLAYVFGFSFTHHTYMKVNHQIVFLFGRIIEFLQEIRHKPIFQINSTLAIAISLRLRSVG